jgi:cytoskeletal protein CcmA (bactofilin family)
MQAMEEVLDSSVSDRPPVHERRVAGAKLRRSSGPDLGQNQTVHAPHLEGSIDDQQRLDAPGTKLTNGIFVSADLHASEDLAIDGRFAGRISLPDHHLLIGSTASVEAKIVARSVTVFGRVAGTITASERVEVLPSASVEGHLTTPSIVLADGARFTGTIDPQATDAAMRVARYRERQAAVGT